MRRSTRLVELDRKPEARILFDQAIAQGRLTSIRDADIGYLAVAVGNDEVASGALRSRACQWTIAASGHNRRGIYRHASLRKSRKPIAYLMEGIDAKADGRIDH